MPWWVLLQCPHQQEVIVASLYTQLAVIGENTNNDNCPNVLALGEVAEIGELIFSLHKSSSKN